ncbi:hydrogenase, membrane subunit 2-like protein [Syntrophobotulus glycolicus DSM 8271]|uniref:Hydrogenase, membrane subunit 2-like protein n=1 Tax=Syntrophobotulus glycolicus (strain DSM 8271 / FlGlyR) TaxID=645991 RepID=F0SVM0_SYNGF|nr:NADH-quinone oxidoreductase subunit K [Syntrophobotulus glycolicus]ADY54496.1 hydrogenase, membrane subunit 2-like protein [Syntrophobotulus glycolicus DSM 8271]
MAYDNLGISNLMITLVLCTCFMILVARFLDTVIAIIVAQAVLLAGLSLSLGYVTGIHEMYFAALLTLAVKAGLIPFILARVIKKVGISKDIKSYLNRKTSLILAGALVIVAYFSTGQIIGQESGLIREALHAGVAMMLIGLLVMTTRKSAVMQITGFIIMENGLFLMGVGTSKGMPPVVELGIFLDMLIGILIMGILVFRINRSFESIDTEKLRNLRG